MVPPAWGQASPVPAAPTAPAFVPPKLKRQVEAIFPEAARAEQRSGTVVLELDVDVDGKVSNVKVTQPAGFGFDEAAQAAVEQFEFEPARRGEVAVPSHVTYSYRFVWRAPPTPAPPPSTASDAAPAEPSPTKRVARLKGLVRMRGTREPLIGALVTLLPWIDGQKILPDAPLPKDAPVAETDEKGRFELGELPAGTYRVIVVGNGARRLELKEKISDRDIVTVDYFVEPSMYTRYQSTVRGELNRQEISRQVLSTEELAKMPGSFGDALRAIENLPGVARSPFSSGLIIVRGARPTDSRVFLGAMEVPQLYHFGGLRSIVPTELVDRVEFMPGNFGVRYGRAIGGVIDMEIRDGKRDRVHGAGETNVFDTGFVVEGPLGKGSFVLAARRSYVDAIIAVAFPKDQGLSFSSAPVYWDYQAQLDHPLWGGKFRAQWTGSDDQLKLAFDRPQDADPVLTAFGTHMWFHKLQLRWTRTVGDWSVLAQASNGFTGQSGQVGRNLNFGFWSFNTELRVEARYSYSKRLKLLVGLDGIYARINLRANIPPPPREGEIPSPLTVNEEQSVKDAINLLNLGLFAEATWRPREWVTLIGGVRLDVYSVLKRATFNPRATARFDVTRLTAIKLGLGLYSQDPQPPDYNAQFGNPKVRPESAVHAVFTVEQGLLPGLKLEATGFYKHLYDLVAVTNNFVLRDDKAIAERVASDGIGRVYGGEFTLRQSVSKWLFGWVSYTVMKSERRDCATCAWRTFDFDQTHILIAALHAYLPRGWELGLRFRYITGLPATKPYGGYYDADADTYLPARGPVNTTRVEAFHQLDFRIDKTFLWKTWVLKAYLDIVNVYNRRNPEVVQPSYDFTRSQIVRGLPIIPSIGMRAEF